MNSDMENKDWIDDYMSLKQVNKANPFTVPDGYFDDLADRIASYKNISELKGEAINGGFTVPEGYFGELEGNILSRVNIEAAVNGGDMGFTVPEGYFDNLSEQINSRIFIEETVGEPVELFAVPEGYFENLSEQIQSRVFIEETLGAPAKPFAVPKGYFENLSEQIQSRIFVEEALNESAEQFAVTAGYFDTLNQNILNKTVNAAAPRKKGIVRRMITSTAFKYATAACFAVAVGGGILLSQVNDPANVHNRSFLHKELSNVPLDDIKSYLQVNVDAGDEQQSVVNEGVKVDSVSLKSALQNDIDSVQ